MHPQSEWLLIYFHFQFAPFVDAKPAKMNLLQQKGMLLMERWGVC